MKAKENKVLSTVKSFPPIIWMILIMMVIFGITAEGYFSWANVMNILRQSVPLLILSLGQTLVILSEGTDLSLGAQVSLVTVLWIMMAQHGIPLLPAAFLAVLAGVLFGVLNGLLVSWGKVPSFIATFGMENILSSIALLLTAGSSIYFSSTVFQKVYEGTVLGLPIPIWIGILMFGITWLLLYRTRFGTNVFGLGGNPEALNLAGVNTVKCYIKTYAYAGLLAGIVGLIVTCRVESGQPTVGNGWEFESVAATILGGTSFTEGKGGIGGTVLGVLLLNMLRNGLNITGVSAMYQNAIIGVIVLAAIVADTLMRRRRG